MRIVYVLLSPTPGMHQYTGDLAAQMVNAGHDVHIVTTAEVQGQHDRYPGAARIHTPVDQHSTGFSGEGLQANAMRRTHGCIVALQPDVVHFSGVHLWNPLLIASLRRHKLRVVHTLHDLDPHPGVAHGALIRLWNRGVIAWADGLVVHGERYRHRLLAAGRPPSTVLATPLLHSFLSATDHLLLEEHMPEIDYAPWALFFGRFEQYKGLDVLLRAQRILAQQATGLGMVLAGAGDLRAIWPHALPQGVTLLNRRIDSAEGRQLFQRCGLLVLPYMGATQSALPATAYAFGKAALVSNSGALAEVVQPDVTGWVVPPGDAEALAGGLAAALNNPTRLAASGAAGRRWYKQERCRQQAQLSQFYTTTISGPSLGDSTG
jgi:glycosyltransferase involved in cell wall biosynthesis